MNATSTFKKTTISPDQRGGAYASPSVRALFVRSTETSAQVSSAADARLALATAEAEQIFVLEKLLTAK